MKFNKKLFSLKHAVISAALLSGIAINTVQADTFTFSVDTIEDVTISEIQPLYFASALNLGVLGTCAFTDLVAADAWTTGDSNFALISTAAASARALTGPACVDTSATSNLGHYLISGGNSAVINITLVTGGADDGSFTFTPQGVADNDTGATGGETVIAADSAAAVTTDASGNIGLLVGGTIEVGLTALTAGTTIPASFDIDVVY